MRADLIPSPGHNVPGQGQGPTGGQVDFLLSELTLKMVHCFLSGLLFLRWVYWFTVK